MQKSAALLLSVVLGFAFVASPTPTAPSENIHLACNISVFINPPPPARVCAPGETVNLSAEVFGNLLDVQWEPSFLVSNPTALNTTATVNGTTTFTVTARGVDDQNLIVNGSFEAGNTGFTSDYSLADGIGNLPEAEYAVTTNPNSVHSDFAACGDHTSGVGNMLVVNGAEGSNIRIWCQTVSVTPNTDYAFSAWVTTLVNRAPAELQFSVNGALLGSVFVAPISLCNWVNFFQIWNPGGNSSAEICIVNQNDAGDGNDFALDDLFFAEVCESIDFVTVEVADLNPEFIPPPDLCQFDFPIDLSTLLLPSTTPGGTWAVDGFPSAGFLDPLDFSIGPHEITYTVDDPPCSETRTQIFNITPPPPATFTPSPAFICPSTLPIDLVTWVDPGVALDGMWTINGLPAIVFDPDQLGVGQHQVTYTVGNDPCFGNDFRVVEIFPLPDASWNPPAVLCSNSSPIILDDLLTPDALPDGTWTIDGIVNDIFDPSLLGNGTYSVIYTTGTIDCPSSEEHPITVANGANSTWLSPGTLCADADSIDLNTLLGNDAATDGDWSIDGVSTDIFNPASLGIGIYTVQYRVGTPPCTTTNAQTIEVVDGPEASWISPDTLCLNDNTVALNALLGNSTAFGGTWQINSTDNDLFTPSFWGIGTHNVTYTVSQNNCSNSESHPIVVIDSISAQWNNPSPICADAASIILDDLLSPTADTSGVWTIAGDTSTVFNTDSLGAGQYVVRYAVGNNRCAAELSDTIEIIAIPDVSWVPPSTLCLNSPSVALNSLLESSASTTGSWTINGIDTSIFHPQVWGVGIHEIIYSDTNQICPNSLLDTIIVIDQTNANWTAPSNLCSGDTSFSLDDLLDAGATPGGVWTLNGQTASSLNPADWAGQTLNATYRAGALACADSLTQTITVGTSPTANFSVSETLLCLDESTMVSFTGMASANADLSWSVDGLPNPASDALSFELNWATPGTYTIQLQVTDEGCVSEVVTQTVEVVAPLAIPLPICGNVSTSGLQFDWAAIPGATDYIVNVLTGQTGVQSGTSISFENIAPDETVTITVEAVGPPPCGNSLSLPVSCTSAACTDLAVSFPDLAPICLSPTTAPIALSALVGGVPQMGTWSGSGISDPSGVFDPQSAGVGVHDITFVYQVDNCTYTGMQSITIRPQPIATFALDANTICQNESVNVTFNGMATAMANYTWNFDGATIISGSAAGPYELSWTTPGSKLISLFIEDNGCTAGPFLQTVQVDSLLSTPTINCTTTENSIIFFWEEVGQAASYAVNVLSGQSGSFTSDTSYLVTSLMPQENVSIELTINSANSCPDLVLTQSCIAENCPSNVQVAISPVDPICLTASTMPLTLNFELLAGLDTGRVSWQGLGLIDTLQGIFDPQVAGVGIHPVQVTYQLGFCQYIASQSIQVLPTPSASFDAPDSICVSENAVLTYTGNAANDAQFSWDFGEATAIPGTGAGPHTLSWPSTGPKTIELQVIASGCASESFSQMIVVQDTLTPPTIQCQSDFNSITFSWPEVPFAESYQVEVTQGPNGSFLDDTTYRIEGLQAEETASILLTVESATACPAISTTATCSTNNCPSIDLAIDSVPVRCWTGLPDTLSLTATIDGDISNGDLVWSGLGIIDPINGIWASDASMIGQSIPITLSYTESGCSYSTTRSIRVNPTPTAEFELLDSICITDTATVIYTGNASASAQFDWDFGTASANPGVGAGPHALTWVTSGEQLVQLSVTDAGCQSALNSQSILVQDTLIPPVIQCEANFNSVTFSWATVPFAESYTIVVIEGPEGIFLNDSTYQIQGLAANASASIELFVESSNSCSGTSVTASCATNSCPAIELAIDSIPDLCWTGMPETLALTATISGDVSNGDLVWSGQGITDPVSGTWRSDASMIGQSIPITLTYTESVCSYTATRSIRVNPTPTASFELVDSICITDTATLTYSGTASDAAQFSWDFGAASANPGIGIGPHTLSWTDAATTTIQLTVEENGCLSSTQSQTILAQAPLDTVQISCEADYTSIVFTWPALANASEYEVIVSDGLSGTFTSPTSYQVSGLVPGTAVGIEVIALSENSCPSSSTTFSCSTLACPDISLAILPIDTVCWDGMNAPVDLEANIIGDVSAGLLTWSGPGILDSTTGLWQANAGLIGGEVDIVLSYQESVCVYSDTLTIAIFEQPTATFELVDTICISDEALLEYMGNASATAVYDWDFGGAIAEPGVGQGPHTLTWAAAGIYTIELTVSENSCESAIEQQIIEVSPAVAAVEASCSSTLTAITIEWPAVEGATDYTIESIPPAGGQWLSDTSYVFEDLAPNTDLSITITPVAATTCPIPSTTVECSTLDCPSTTLDWAAPAVLCSGDTFTLNVDLNTTSAGTITVVYTDGAQNYTWNPDDPILFEASATTTFSVVSIEDAAAPVCPINLPAPITVTVNEPVFAGLPNAPAEVCSRTATVLDLSDSLMDADPNGHWQDFSDPPINTGLNTTSGLFDTQNTMPGSYQIGYLLAGPEACPSDTAIVTIVIHPTPIADAGPDQTLDCLVNQVSLGGPNTSSGPSIRYEWSALGAAMLSVTDLAFTDVIQPDQFELTVIDEITGCSESDQVVVDSDVALIVPFPSVTPISCFEANDGRIVIDSIVGGTPPYSVRMNGEPVSGNFVFGPLVPGLYDLQVSDAAGCEASVQFELEQPNELTVTLNANLELGQDVIKQGEQVRLSIDSTVLAQAIDTVLWSPADTLPCGDCTELLVTPLESTTFRVTIQDINGCTASDALTLFVQKNRNIFIPNAFSPNNDGDNDELIIFGGSDVAKVNSMRIFNRWGEQVFKQLNFFPNDPATSWDGTFRGQVVNGGVYVYMAEVELIDGEVVLLKGDVTVLR
ncbi:MAG: gliding motility-associated C-terminal domain-containing protein [Bacteroidota bacterium]